MIDLFGRTIEEKKGPKKKESVCCHAGYREETWVSKTRRRIYYCLDCGEPCEIEDEDE